MADYNYVKETFEIETITDAIESLQKRILAFSDKIDTEDVTKLCNIIDDAKKLQDVFTTTFLLLIPRRTVKLT